MGKVLKQTVVVRQNPPIGSLHTFLAGEELPDWAHELIGPADHLFKTPVVSEESTPTRAQIDAATPKPVVREEEPEEVDIEVPAVTAAKKIWHQFLIDAYGVNLDYDDNTRDEMIEKVRELDPELEIPED